VCLASTISAKKLLVFTYMDSNAGIKRIFSVVRKVQTVTKKNPDSIAENTP